MREILFRGKTEDGKWAEGFYSPLVLPIVGEMGHYINEGGFRAIEVIPETVGQYTGLTDKNGKKMFEGDIISAITVDTKTESKAVIGYGNFVDENNGDEYIGFYIEFDGIKTTITQLLMEEVKDRFEVIGNIYDNPELLEVEE